MRIDANQGEQPLPESGRTTSQNPLSAEAHSAAGNAVGEDQAQVSGAQAQIQALASQAAQLPDFGQEKVSALRQIVLGGSYQPSPQQTAEALFAHMLVQPGS